jgi:BCD family chlorophyll transporter-like MFS transporter
MVLNCVALWKQEARSSDLKPNGARAEFRGAWLAFAATGRTRRRLVATALGTAGFSMQDILLEPYGGKILHLPVGTTTAFTAMLAIGGGVGLYVAARWLTRGAEPHRVAASGAMVGVIAFATVAFAAPAASGLVFATGVALIGLGGGLFAHGTLTASMTHAPAGDRGLALGAWGAAQATAAGLAIGVSGIICDVGTSLATQGVFGEALVDPATGYALVYLIEILLLFATLIAIGPLVRSLNGPIRKEAVEFDLVPSSGLNSGVTR